MSDFASIIADELGAAVNRSRRVTASPEAVAIAALLRASLRHPELAEALDRATSLDEVLDVIAADRVLSTGLVSVSAADLRGMDPRRMLHRAIVAGGTR